MAHKFKVRLTRMLNAWVEVEAETQEEAEDKAFYEVVDKPGGERPWSDDGDVQVEDDTYVLVDGRWENVYEAPKERGGMA